MSVGEALVGAKNRMQESMYGRSEAKEHQERIMWTVGVEN